MTWIPTCLENPFHTVGRGCGRTNTKQQSQDKYTQREREIERKRGIGEMDVQCVNTRILKVGLAEFVTQLPMESPKGIF